MPDTEVAGITIILHQQHMPNQTTQLLLTLEEAAVEETMEVELLLAVEVAVETEAEAAVVAAEEEVVEAEEEIKLKQLHSNF